MTGKGIAPRVGAWIEMSHWCKSAHTKNIAPRVGAWIEIVSQGDVVASRTIAPRVGAWIEIVVAFNHLTDALSHLV